MASRKHQHVLAAYLVRFFAPGRRPAGETNSQSPAGAGISDRGADDLDTPRGALVGRDLDQETMRVIAQNVEAQVIRVPTVSDYYPAIYGG